MNRNDDTAAPEIELRIGSWAELGEAAGALRLAVFVREQGIPAALEYDGQDARSVHCVAYCDGEPAGTGRLLADGHIGRMAVRADQRGRGIGRRVLEALIEVARARGDASVELSAQSRAAAFYRTQGFEPVGEPHEEAGIPHQKMRRSLLVFAAWAGAAAITAAGAPQARAGVLDAVSNADAASALRGALERGAAQAVARLGRPGGFLDEPRVRIPLPDGLRQAEGLLRAMGRGRDLDELVTSMNRAAEQAVPQAKQLLVAAVKSMSVSDAKAILTGGDDSVTQYFKRTTSAPLAEKFLPIVRQATERVELAKKYNRYAKQGAKLGLIDKKDASLEAYVTEKALDGLFLMIAEEERAIRKNPLGQASSLLQKVFGALR